MTKLTRPSIYGLRHRLAVGGLAVLAAALVSGCGAEPDKSVPVANPTAVPVQGMSQQDYAKQMQQKAAGMSGGGGAAPGMDPGGGAPGGPPGPPAAPPK